MIQRAACVLFLSTFLLASCDETSSAENSESTTPALRHPAGLVGSWIAPAGDYAFAHMVLRADGTGASVGVSGTRRDVRSIRWNADDTLFVLSDSSGMSSSKSYRLQGDTLRLLTRYLLAEQTDTILFVREPEPSLVPTAGERAATLAGDWNGQSRTITTTLDGSGNWVPSDTFWIPDAFLFQGDGTGMHLDYENEYVCDTLPLGSSCFADGYCDSLTTPTDCDPAYDGACTYSALRRCHETYVPTDTTRFTWWTSRNDLYLGMWQLGSTTPTGFIGTQVMGWSVEGDSLQIQAYYDKGLVQRYRRAP